MISSNLFFRSHQADEIAYLVSSGADVIQTNPVIGNPLQSSLFNFQLPTGSSAPFTLYYSLSGTASNGLDYVDANGNPLSGAITLLAAETATNLEIFPAPGRTILNPLTITMTLTATNTYLINPDGETRTIRIWEPLFAPVALVSGAVGIDYQGPANSLIVSVKDSALPYTFQRIYLSGANVVVTNWTTLARLEAEVELATPKQTLAGFTNGDVFFGNNNYSDWSSVGWIAASGTNWDVNWCVLTNASGYLPLQGGLYVDRTGTFSNDLVAVSGEPPGDSACDVWLIGTNRQPRLLTTIYLAGLEGVITLTNDPAKWGPWAASIVTGDENHGIIYSISTNGTTTSYPLGIASESFDVVPTNQNFYACDPDYYGTNGVVTGAILKLPASYFTNYVGQLLINQGGEKVGVPAELFFVQWNAATTNFVTSSITYMRPDGTQGHFEHATFAPLDLPYLSP